MANSHPLMLFIVGLLGNHECRRQRATALRSIPRFRPVRESFSERCRRADITAGGPSVAGRAMLLQTEQLTKRYGTFAALDALTVTMAAGEVVGLLGPNGAGQTAGARLRLGF